MKKHFFTYETIGWIQLQILEVNLYGFLQKQKTNEKEEEEE